MKKVNYDNVADVYKYRYQNAYSPDGIFKKLHKIELKNNFKTILEVGCGTGHWLKAFENNKIIIGIDPSFMMLAKAQKTSSSSYLIQGSSDHLPIKKNSIDFIFCINAIHHFDDPEKFIVDCKSLLHPNGKLTVVCMNPHSGSDKWFLYEFFDGTMERDIRRYPSPENLETWLLKAGFSEITFQVGERLKDRIVGKDIFPLPKEYTSQLSLLTDEQYETGIRKILHYTR
ncbi:MAG: methyltransferase domain-containing protein [Desulfobacteraceae bacterium]|jgi:SAM-dependent methyltransferase